MFVEGANERTYDTERPSIISVIIGQRERERAREKEGESEATPQGGRRRDRRNLGATSRMFGT